MYELFYNLKAEPFRLSPDHKFCYEHTGYAKARAYMAYAFLRAEGFVMITGRPGTGKTTLVGELVENLARDNVSTANLVCTQLGADDLLKTVAYNFGIQADSVDKAELLQHLSTLFHRWHRDGRRALLVVDEAQDLSLPAMEELRLLTNIQKDGQPLLQIFLLGQPELRELILSPEMEQVHQRIVAASHLEGLAADEVENYVMHRLLKVGWAGDPAISRAIFPLIHQFSEGVPRRINLICSRLFLHGGVEQRHEISVADLRVVIGELQSEHLAAGTRILPEDFELAGQQEWVQVPESAMVEKRQSELHLRAVSNSAPARPAPTSTGETTPGLAGAAAKKKGVADRLPREKTTPLDEQWPRTGAAPQTQAPQDTPREPLEPAVSPFTERKADTDRARSYPVRSTEPSLDDAGRPGGSGRSERASKAARARGRTASVDKAAAGQGSAPSRFRPFVILMTVLVLFALAAGVFLLPYIAADKRFADLAWWNEGAAVVPAVASGDDAVLRTVGPEEDSAAVFDKPALAGDAGRLGGDLAPGDSASPMTADWNADMNGDMNSRGASFDKRATAPGPAPLPVAPSALDDPGLPLQQPEAGRERAPVEAPQRGLAPLASSAGAGAEDIDEWVDGDSGTLVDPAQITAAAAPEPAVASLDQPLMLLVGFSFDSVRLEEEALAVLAEAARVLERQWSSRAEITGFADQSGDAVYNLDLSWDRARAVEEYLVAAGIDRQRLEVEGRGVVSELTPSEMADNKPAADAERNRIVQIKIYPGPE
ncbi:MAG: AAA family ATPase [Gammaproteobacteria bacterium]|nr:AAA family ATPase [Gammaproteobacteria bacterium]